MGPRVNVLIDDFKIKVIERWKAEAEHGWWFPAHDTGRYVDVLGGFLGALNQSYLP